MPIKINKMCSQIVFGGNAGGAAVVRRTGDDTVAEGGQGRAVIPIKILLSVCILPEGFYRLIQQKIPVRQP